MAEKLFEGQQLDAATQKIVDEMAAVPVKPEEKPEVKPEAKPEEKKEEAAPEGEPKAKIILDDEEEGEEEEVEKPSRSGKFVPLSKLQKEKQKRKELEVELERFKSQEVPKKEEVVEDDEFAKSLEAESGIDSKVIKKILDHAVSLASQKSKLPDDVIKQIQEFQEQKGEQESELVFNREFETLKKNPDYADIDRDKLYELAHTNGKVEIDGVKYPIKDVPLRVLVEVGGLKNPKKKSAETSRGGSRATETKDYKGMSLSDLAKLPPMEFLEASNELAKKKSIY